MGFSENFPDDLGFESDPKKWVVAGIQLRAPLMPISSNPIRKEHDHCCDGEDQPPTPTGDDSRIRSSSKCPPAPKKRKSSLKFNYGNARQFFEPPDLEVLFSRHVERANWLLLALVENQAFPRFLTLAICLLLFLFVYLYISFFFFFFMGWCIVQRL